VLVGRGERGDIVKVDRTTARALQADEVVAPGNREVDVVKADFERARAQIAAARHAGRIVEHVDHDDVIW